MQKENKYQIDTLLWGQADADCDEHYADEVLEDGTTIDKITFEVYAKDEKDAWSKGEAYMYNNYNQEMYNADTTITKVGA